LLPRAVATASTPTRRHAPPTGRSATTQIFPDSAGPFIQPQLLDAYVYLGSTRAHSVTSYNGGGSLEERGATWLFLRWLASQKGEDIFGRLVQTSNTGINNVQTQSGESFGALSGSMIPGTMVHSNLTSPAGGAGITLSFTGPLSVPFPTSLGAQVTVFRMPP
jgi:hypothetical protein